MVVWKFLAHLCLNTSSMSNRMTRVIVSLCIVMSYVLRPDALDRSYSTFETTFCWKLNVVIMMSCNWLRISEVAGQSAPLAVALISSMSFRFLQYQVGDLAADEVGDALRDAFFCSNHGLGGHVLTVSLFLSVSARCDLWRDGLGQCASCICCLFRSFEYGGAGVDFG